MAAPLAGATKKGGRRTAPRPSAPPPPPADSHPPPKVSLSADPRDRTYGWSRRDERSADARPDAEREAALPAPPPPRDDPNFDPIAAVGDGSVRLEEILAFEWTGRGKAAQGYVSDNLATVLKGAAAYARAERDAAKNCQVRAMHLLRAQLASALLIEGEGFRAYFRAADRKRFFSRLLNPDHRKEDLAAITSSPPLTPEDMLHWEGTQILAKASELRRATNNRYRDIGQRHLIVALFVTKVGQTALRDMGAFASGYDALRSAIVACCDPVAFSAFGDSKKAWEKIISDLKAAPPLVDPIERRPEYLNDRVRPISTTQTGEEPLGAAEDARALADLILLEAAAPPIAIGLFGPWGSGKSTLIEHLKAEIRRQSRLERGARATGGATDGRTRIVANVVQLSFNAWTFADSSNLWASFTSEIFDQLAAGGGTADDDSAEDDAASDPQMRATAAALVSEVAARTACEVASMRVATVAVQEHDLAIKAAEDMLQKARAQKRATFALAVLDTAGELKGRKEDDDAREKLGDLVRWSVANGLQRAALAALGVILLVGLIYGMSRLDPSWPRVSAALAAAWSAIGVVVALAWPVLAALGTVASHWLRRSRIADRAITEARGDLRERTAARAAAERERSRSESFLSAYEMEGSGSITTSPMRMLDYLLKESEAVAAVRAQTGLLATVRRCFEQLELVIASARRHDPDSAIDRIILYIDDLDRCSTSQVSEILQAVHLLLSFDCFVVVVAADANWLKQSLQDEHSQLFKEGGSLTPADYLEKIFQIPFWVRPLVDVDAKPENRFQLYEIYVDHLLREEETAAPETPAVLAADGTAATPGEARSFTRRPPGSRDDPLERRRERIKLSQQEKAFLKGLGPLAAKSPRAVKRMINIYRLIRVRLDGPRLDSFMGGGSADAPSYKAILFALACEVGLPAATMAWVADALSRLSKAEWENLRDALVLDSPGLTPSGPTKDLREALRTAGRLDDFLAALEASPGLPDQPQIHMGLEEVRRYSFRPL